METSNPCGTFEVLKHLTNSTQTQQALTRWDLVNCNAFANSQGHRGEAWPLVHALEMSENGGAGLVWEKWSTDHPKLAAVLWPAVQEIAIHRAYFVIPELLESVYEEKTEIGLREKIARFSAKGGLIQSEKLIELELWADATVAIDWTLKHSDKDSLEPSDLKRLRELNNLVISQTDKLSAQK